MRNETIRQLTIEEKYECILGAINTYISSVVSGCAADELEVYEHELRSLLSNFNPRTITASEETAKKMTKENYMEMLAEVAMLNPENVNELMTEVFSTSSIAEWLVLAIDNNEFTGADISVNNAKRFGIFPPFRSEYVSGLVSVKNIKEQ